MLPRRLPSGIHLVLIAGCASVAIAGKSDSATLLQLASTWGEHFAGIETWKLSNPCSKWYGVTCSGNRGFNVTSLNLADSRIAGPIPPQIADLESLTFLDLSSRCPGEFGTVMIPKFIDEYPCSVPYNKITGDLPISFSAMTQLRVLALWAYEEFYGTWSAISSLSRLERLSLSEMHMMFTRGVPQSLSAFTALTLLELGYCKFSGSFPSALKSLTRLETLRLHANSFTGRIPSFVSRFTRLKVLTLSGNSFVGGVPTFLGSLRRLRVLKLDGWNPYVERTELSVEQTGFLGGSIPHSLGQLQNLEELTIMSQNLTSSLPASLGNLKKLTSLVLSINGISGSIPNALSGLSRLQYVFLEVNQLKGKVPKYLVNLPKLEGLLLGNNKLSGALPHLPTYKINEGWREYTFVHFSFSNNFLTSGDCSDVVEDRLNTNFNCIAGCDNQKTPEECVAFRNGTVGKSPPL